MNRKVLASIIKKDVRAMLSSKRTWIPMTAVTALICVVLPLALAYLGTYTDSFNSGNADNIKKMTDGLMAKLPGGHLKDQLSHLKSTGEKFVYFYLNFNLITMFMMVTVINSLVSASSSLVGEKERGTLETLLFSPIKIKELFAGKILASFIPSICLTYAAFLLTFGGVNAMVSTHYREVFMFNGIWLTMMFWSAPSLILLIILINVFISARSKTYQEAQQFGGLLVLPMVGVVVSQAAGLFLFSPAILFAVGAVFFAIDIALLALVIKKNQRNTLFETQIH